MARIDANLPLQIAALDASIGRKARLHASPREGPESGRKPALQCEPEIGFNTLSTHSSEPIWTVAKGKRTSKPYKRRPPVLQDTWKARSQKLYLPC
jgi:hypothetical protein